MRKPLIALVGRPNVGKSTLFNRIIGERKAVISEIPGTTRDRLQSDADWNGVPFTVIDTGGIEVYQPKGGRDLSPLAEGSLDFVLQIRGQAMIAIEEADLIVMVVDTQQGVTAADEEIATILQKTDKPVIVAANKMDNRQHYNDTLEFYTLGLGEVVWRTTSVASSRWSPGRRSSPRPLRAWPCGASASCRRCAARCSCAPAA
jgi:GTP-binding protein